LKNVELKTYKESIERIKFLISHLFQLNLYLCEGDRLNEFVKKDFYRYCSKEVTEEELQLALIFLAECLYTFHQKRVIILIDEYDAPINNALIKGYYEEMIGFMRSFLGSVFKTNDYLEFCVLTGVQRISKESFISEFNNSKANLPCSGSRYLRSLGGKCSRGCSSTNEGTERAERTKAAMCIPDGGNG